MKISCFISPQSPRPLRTGFTVILTAALALVITAQLHAQAVVAPGAPTTKEDTSAVQRKSIPAFDATDESAVRALVVGFVTTWNRHDMKAMHELDTEDVEWINVTGNHWRGKAAVFKGHDTIHRTIFAKTTMNLEAMVIRAIAPNVAIAVTTLKGGPMTMPSGVVLAEIKTKGSFIMVKRDRIWKIVHFHNTTVDPEAEKNDPVTWDETGYLPGRK